MQEISVIIIEHNLDVIKCADYIIDLGPEGGEKAVKLFLRAHPRIAASVGASYTGKYLKEKLADA